MNLHDFLIPPAESARRKGPHDRIVLSSRVRLARNLKDATFPGWAKKPERLRVLELIRPAIESLPEMREAFAESMDNLSALDKQILVERHLISREHAAKSAGSAVVLNRDETFCVMINEEDHLRMQALRPGLQLRQAWNALDQLDSALERQLNFAFNPDWRGQPTGSFRMIFNTLFFGKEVSEQAKATPGFWSAPPAPARADSARAARPPTLK